jgi:nitroreductase
MILQGLTVGFLVVGLAAACCESKDAAAPYCLDEKGAAAQPGAAPAAAAPAGKDCAREAALDVLLTRRSIRKYEQKPVPDAMVQKILEAAMEAPSAGNQQPWRFIVIRDRALLNDIPSVHPYAGMLKEADLAILVVADVTAEKYPGYFPQDCSAATENILLAAHAQGLGSVWLGVFPDEERVRAVGQKLGVPANLMPFSLVAIGWPAEDKGRGGRFDAKRIYLDKWEAPWKPTL